MPTPVVAKLSRLMPTSIILKSVDFLSLEGLPRYYSDNQTVITDAAVANYTFQLPVDSNRPVSSGCFETCAKQFDGGQLSYQDFLDATLLHVDPESPVRHPEDCDLANLTSLSACGPMGPVAAAIKLCMLSSETSFDQQVIDLLRRLSPCSEASSDEFELPPLLRLPPLQLQVVIVAALRRGLPDCATDILSSYPEPPKESLFNLLGCVLCPVHPTRLEDIRGTLFGLAPVTFWLAALRAGWVTPSPNLAYNVSSLGPSGAPLLRALLDNSALDLALPTSHPVYRGIVVNVAQFHDDASLLRDILVRLPPDATLEPPDLLRIALFERSQGGVGMLAALLDYRDRHGHGLDINYKTREGIARGGELRDPWGGGWGWEVSMTPLCYAARRGNVDAIRFLISKGADINILAYDGIREWSPRDLAISGGHREVVRMLDEAAEQRPQED